MRDEIANRISKTPSPDSQTRTVSDGNEREWTAKSRRGLGIMLELDHIVAREEWVMGIQLILNFQSFVMYRIKMTSF